MLVLYTEEVHVEIIMHAGGKIYKYMYIFIYIATLQISLQEIPALYLEMGN